MCFETYIPPSYPRDLPSRAHSPSLILRRPRALFALMMMTLMMTGLATRRVIAPGPRNSRDFPGSKTSEYRTETTDWKLLFLLLHKFLTYNYTLVYKCILYTFLCRFFFPTIPQSQLDTTPVCANFNYHSQRHVKL